MKIAFINIYQDQSSRGAETFVYELAKRLSEKHEVDIISGGKSHIPEWRKSPLWRSFLDPNSLAIAGFTFKNLGRIYKEKYNIVIPTNGGWQPALVRIVTWLYGGKVIISGQSGIGWHDMNNLWCFPNTFVALSTKALRWARQSNYFIKSVYIPNGVDLNRFNPGVSSVKTGEKTVLAVGAFTEQKRLDLVIKAVSKLEKVNLIITGGGGSLKEKIMDYGMKLLGEGRFRVLSVPFENIPEVYRSADVFTLPSASSEAFGNVLVEAMASNLPVVATDDPVRKEIIGDAGILVDPRDTDSYAKAITHALEKNWGDTPRRQAEKFSWDKISQKYEEVIVKLTK